MYDKLVLEKINNLQYLKITKKSNVSIISKKNPFGDVVKFFAQINKNDIIQKFSFKATGCTHFVVYCDYFCSLVEGKTIEDALKINKEDLEQFETLTDSKLHIVKIILDTFALLIKKYRKGISAGTIEGVEVEENVQVQKKTSIKKERVDVEIEDIALVATNKTKKSKSSAKVQQIEKNESTSKENTSSSKSSKIDIAQETNLKKITKSSKVKEEKSEEKKSKKEAKILAKEIKVQEEAKSKAKSIKQTEKQTKAKKSNTKAKIEEIEVIEPEVENNVATILPESVETTISSNTQGATIRHRVEKTTRITRVATENDEIVAMEHHEMTQSHSLEHSDNSIKQASNIMALKAMINTSKNTDNVKIQEDEKVQELSSKIESVNSKNQKAVEEKEQADRISSIRNNLEKLNKRTSKQEKNKDNIENSSEIMIDEPKKKKGLFGWLRRK